MKDASDFYVNKKNFLKKKKIKKIRMKTLHKHTYHLVEPSRWPLVTSISAYFFTMVFAFTIHNMGSIELLSAAITALVTCVVYWFRDIIREASYFGQHTATVQKALDTGFFLFLITEGLFFVSFFWAFFHCSLSPSMSLGGVWPPAGMEVPNPWKVPFYNTIILLVSGATVTWSHHETIAGSRLRAEETLLITILLGSFFLVTQMVEYHYK